MALPATLRRFTIQLADSDRGIYEELDWRVPQHPSENERYLVARVLARALEHADGMEFSKGGVSDDEEPAIIQKNLRGEWLAWIEVGSPSPDRLHKAQKLAPRVAVYAWKNVDALADAIREREVHRREELELKSLPAETLDAIAATLDRVNKWDLSVAGGAIYLTINGALFELAVTVIPIA
ncbi:MAG: YaeQ family protein [Kofleriaceae bacterium]